MQQSVFQRIFIWYGIILLLTALVAELMVTRSVRQNHIDTLRDNLAAHANIISWNIPFRQQTPLDELCQRFKELTAARITIIAVDGRVLGDSDHGSLSMDNHLDRAEVLQANFSQIGTAVRRSDTMNADLLYVAKKIIQGGKPAGFVRLSVPLTKVDASINQLRLKINLTVTAVLLATGMFSFWQIERLRRLTRQIRDFAAAIAAGYLDKRLFLHRAGEFEDIAGSLNNMAVSLQGEIWSLRDEKAKFETALLGISDGVLLLDQNGRVELANRVFHEMFDVRGAIIGRPFLEVVRNHRLVEMARQAHERRVPAAGELEIVYPRLLYVFAAALPIVQETMREDRYRGTVVALHDITQLRKLEQVRKDFVANVSHEIKTPITAIQGFSETLLAGALDDRDHARAFIETILANSRRIDSLVDDLMTISKIELGVTKVEMTDVAFKDVAQAVLAVLKDKAVKKNLALTTFAPPELGMLRADRDRLLQILTNLVDNAIKFTEVGTVAFGIRAENGRTVLFVEDTGIGITAQHVARLGERFYRVDAARSRGMGGTGLGLAIVKHLVKAHGWDMRIDSTPGKGTAVKIFLL